MAGNTSTTIAPHLPGGIQPTDRIYVSRGEDDFHALGSDLPDAETKVTGYFGVDPTPGSGMVGATATLTAGEVTVMIPNTSGTAVANVTLLANGHPDTVKYLASATGGVLTIQALLDSNFVNTADASIVNWMVFFYS